MLLPRKAHEMKIPAWMVNPDKLKTIKRLISLFSPFKTKFIVISILLLIHTAVFLLLPLMSQQLIDEGILKKDFSYTVLISLLVLGIAIIISCIRIASEFIRTRISFDISQSLYSNAFEALIKRHIGFFKSKNTTEIYNDIHTDINNMINICDNSVFFSLTQALSFIGGVVGLCIIDIRMTLIVLLFIPLKLIIVLYFSKMRQMLFNYYIEASNKLGHWFGDSVSGIKEIRLFNMLENKKDELSARTCDANNSMRKISMLDAYNFSSDFTLMQILISLLYIIGADFIFNNTLTFGSLFAFIAYSNQVLNPISAILNLNYMLVGIIPSANRYFDFIDTSEKSKEHSGERDVPSFDELVFKNVSFAYDDTPILLNANFSISSGEKVAIIGKNGVGKSTIFSLIQRFESPQEGEILVNGKNLNDYRLTDWRQALICVNQDSYLFDDTIKNNVIMQRALDEKAIERALVSSGVLNFMGSAAATVGQNGIKLSGGQKQKIIYARTLAGQPSLILLDELTSSLDVDSIQSVLEALEQELKNTTILLITHNFSFLSKMDKILFHKGNGHIECFNGYDSLLAVYPTIEDTLNN